MEYSSSPEASGRGFDASESQSERSLYDLGSESEGKTEEKGAQVQKRSGLGLTSKVIMLMLLVSLIPGIAYFAVTFTQTNERIKEETGRAGLQVTELLTDEVNQWVDKNVRVLNTLAGLPEMQTMDRMTQEVMLREVQKQYPWMYLVFTLDPNGMNVARSDTEGLKDYSNREYYKSIKDGKSLAWQNLIGKTSHKPALVVAVPIKKDGQIVGVLASAMTLDAITKIVTNWKLGQTGYVFIVDQNGKVVAHQNKKFVQEQKNLSSHPLVKAARNNVMGMVEFKGLDGKDSIGFARKTDLGWTLAVQQNKNEAFAALKKAQSTAFLLFAATIISILFIAYFASRAIVTPIRKLTDAANRISVGELSFSISTDNSPTLMRFAASVNLRIGVTMARLAK